MKKIKNFKTVLGVVIVGLTTLLPSCVQGDFSELYDEDEALLSYNQFKRTKFGSDTFNNYTYYIPNELMGTTGCALRALCRVLPNYSEEQIRESMSKYSNVENFEQSKFPDVINNLTGKSVTTYNSGGNAAINDIVCVPGIAITSEISTTGHCAVVTGFATNPYGETRIIQCHDGSVFNENRITYLVKTSSLQ